MLPPQRERRARLVVDAYARMHLAAVGSGELDKGLAVSLARFPRRARVDVAGVPIGVFSVDQTTGPPSGAREQLADGARSLRAEGARFVIALVHGSSAAVRDLVGAKGLGVDLAVLSHEGFGPPVPERVGDAWVVQAPAKGKMLGVVDLHVVGGSLAFSTAGGRAQIEEQLRSQQGELAGLRDRIRQATSPDLVAAYERMARALEQAIAEGRQRLERAGAAAEASWIDGRQVALSSEIPDEREVAGLLRVYKEDVARMPAPTRAEVASTAQAPLAASVIPTAAAARDATGAATGGATPTAIGGYVGGEACARCHPAAQAFWRTTRHARAMPALAARHQDHDPACILCHVTGGPVALDGATGPVAVRPLLANVQCEACHGPGAAHVQAGGARGAIQRGPTEAQCRTCHTPAQTSEWDYVAFRAAILGKGHGRR